MKNTRSTFNSWPTQTFIEAREAKRFMLQSGHWTYLPEKASHYCIITLAYKASGDTFVGIVTNICPHLGYWYTIKY